LESGTWQGKDFHGIIRTQVVNRAPYPVYCKDDEITEVEAACHAMDMGAMRASIQFCILVSQQNHTDESMKALPDAPKRL
jgi:hypothetical protein